MFRSLFIIKLALVGLLVLAIGLAGLILVRELSRPGYHSDVLSVLHGIDQTFLAVSRADSLHVSTVDDSNLLLGPRQGLARIQVTGHSGVDLRKVQPEQIRQSGQQVTVRLPEPELLALEADLSSYEATTKESALRRIADNARGRPLRTELFERTGEALKQYREQMPTESREQIVDRLNRESRDLFGPDLEVRFE